MKLMSKLLALLVLALPVSALADDAQSLQQLLKPIQNLQGQFSQQQFHSDGELLLQSDGDFALQRPGKFVWNTAAPFEQVLVSNGKKLWLYDPDLEQVSIKTVDANLQQTPMLILTGDSEVLETNFQIVETPSESNSQQRQFLLLPRQLEPVFERLIIVFNNNILSKITVHDSLGQLTQFELLNAAVNSDLDSNQFEFEIPDGTEVIADE
jgi:outer membrane lipoprotein carrier protein